MLLVLRLVPHLPRMLQTHLHFPSVRVVVEAMVVVVVVVVVQSGNGRILLPHIAFNGPMPPYMSPYHLLG